MKKSPWSIILFLIVVFGSVLIFFVSTEISSWRNSGISRLTNKKVVLHLEINGIIIDGKKFLEPLKKYREEDHVKAIVIEMNSPGGVVGPSQEIYEEIKRSREEFKKPIVVVSTALMASGAYYAAVAADKIVVAPGTLVGSIGVIMEFMNLEKLYDWAKVSRFSVSTGKYKDSGADYRSMREDERQLFQDLVDDVYKQFVDTVAEGRKLKLEEVTPWADGRVFTGRQAKELGFADQIGMVEDAHRLAASIAGLGEDYEVIKPPKEKSSLWDFMTGTGEEDGTVLWGSKETALTESLRKLLRAELMHRPLYLMPGAF